MKTDRGGLPTDNCTADKQDRRERTRPPVLARLKQEDPQAARTIQSAVTEQFLAHFQKGLAVIGFERSDSTGTYLFGEWKQPHEN